MVHVYTSSPDAFFVNSFFFEAPEGVIVVDTQFILPEAEKLKAEVKKLGKPVAAVFLTHPHPDHVNGTGVLKAEWPDLEIVATQSVADATAAIAGPKHAQWKPILGDAYPDEVLAPTRIVESGKPVTIAGETFTFLDFGPLESISESAIEYPAGDALFAGDTFYNQVHPWLMEGRSVAWRDFLESKLDYLAGFGSIYVGHGSKATAQAARDQIAYMDDVFLEIREALAEENPISAARRSEIEAGIKDRYAGWPLEMLVGMNFEPLVAELAPIGAS